MNLEIITNILIDNAQKFIHQNLDMSMFSEEEIPRIYALAAEGTLLKGDFRATANYLFFSKQWARLIELGVPFLHSEDKEEQNAGKRFLEIVMTHDKLPKTVAVELADHILKNDGEYSSHRAAMALKSGNAIDEATDMAYKFFNKGDFENGNRFLEFTGKKLTKEEIEKFSDIALTHQKYKAAFGFYESASLPIPKIKANAMANHKGGWLDDIINYMEKTKNMFTPEELKELAETEFSAGNYYHAMKIYEKTGKATTPQEYENLGEQILSKSKDIESSRTSWGGGVWGSVADAQKYLLKSDETKAKQRLARYANELLDQPNFTRAGSNLEQFEKIYETIKVPIPMPHALKAAKLAEKEKKYGFAAQCYAAAGMNDAAKRVGVEALKSDDRVQKKYGAELAFHAAGDKDALAIAKFLEKNLHSI